MSLGWILEIAPTGTIFDDPDSLTWVDLSARVRMDPKPQASHGRDPDIGGIPQAGTGKWRLDSADGVLRPGNTASPYYPVLDEPGVPIRWTCLDGDGVRQHLFYGTIDKISPTYRGLLQDWTVVDLEAVGGWAVIVRMGPRLTFPDRVGTDLAGPKSLDAMVGNMLWVEPDPPGSPLNPVQLWPSGIVYNGDTWPNLSEQSPFGMPFLRLLDTGRLTWATPGAGCVIAQTGGPGDWSGQIETGTLRGDLMPWASDRPGGQYLFDASGNVFLGVDSGRCLVNWQGMVGRPPVQLDNGSTNSLAGWAASSGSLALVDLSGQPWMPHVQQLDPDTGVITSVLDPALSGTGVQWTGVSAGSLDSPPYPVTAGKYYSPLYLVNNTTAAVTVRWYDSSGTFLSASTPAVRTNSTTGVQLVGGLQSSSRKMAPALQAPGGAVTARVRLTRLSNGIVTTVGVAGFYEAPDTGFADTTQVWAGPARHWPVGEHLHQYLWLQWRAASEIQVVCARVDVTSWQPGEYHQVAFNRDLGGRPVVWVDGQRAAATFTVTSVAARGALGQISSIGQGTGFTGGDPTPVTKDSAKVDVPAVLLGAYAPNVGHPLDDDLVARAWTEHGAPETLGTHATSSTTPDVIGYTLDQANWPRTMRDIPASTATLPSFLGVQWPNNAGLSDYSAFLRDIATIELGWLDVDQAGRFLSLPRFWFDPDRDGLAEAQFHWTWRAGIPGTFQYRAKPPPQPVWPFRDVPNRLLVTNGNAANNRLRVDLASQRRGVRAKTVQAQWAAAEMDDVADLIASTYSPGPRIDSVTLRAQGGDSQLLTHLLARRTGDVGIIDLPQTPGPDLTLSVLITSINFTPFGEEGLEATFGLARCPVPAVDPAPTGVYPAADLYPATDLYPAA